MSELSSDERAVLACLDYAKQKLDLAVNTTNGFRDLRVFNTVNDARALIDACIEEIKSKGDGK